MLYVRPVVRSYTWQYREQAAAWVRSGGHGIVWKTPRKARLLFVKPRVGDDYDLGWWSILDLGRSDYRVARVGALSGLAYIRVPHDCYSIVRDRIVRDSIHPGPTRKIALDCLQCGACCRDNRVELEAEDIARFEEAGRSELAKPPYAKRDGKWVLVLRKDKTCKHLGPGLRCQIYPFRPDACRTFPAGSECCLSAREDELGVVDGAIGPS